MTIVLPIAIFALSMCGTPGPNNIMLAASGANFGFRRTIIHIIGVQVGMFLLLTSGALGIGLLFELIPALQIVLKILGSAYMLYLAWRIIASKRAGETEEKGRPFTLLEAAAFQFINPKGLVIAVTTISTLTKPGDAYVGSVIMLICVFAVVGSFTASSWAAFGTVIARFLKKDFFFKLFNCIMSGLLVLSILFILL